MRDERGAGCLWNTDRLIGAWRSLVARTVRVGEVPGSNPGAPIGEMSALSRHFVPSSGRRGSNPRRGLATRPPCGPDCRRMKLLQSIQLERVEDPVRAKFAMVAQFLTRRCSRSAKTV